MNIAEVLREIADTFIYGTQPNCALDAIRIIGGLDYQHIQMPEFVWRNNGGLQIEWHTERGQIEVYIGPDQAATFWVEEYGGDTFEFSLFGNADKLDAYAQRIAPEPEPATEPAA